MALDLLRISHEREEYEPVVVEKTKELMETLPKTETNIDVPDIAANIVRKESQKRKNEAKIEVDMVGQSSADLKEAKNIIETVEVIKKVSK